MKKPKGKTFVYSEISGKAKKALKRDAKKERRSLCAHIGLLLESYAGGKRSLRVG